MDVFEAIADPIRRDLLGALAGGPVRVVDLASAHPVSRPAISRHLRVLGEAGLVVAEVRGRENHYRLVREPLDTVVGYLTELGHRVEAERAEPTAGPPVPQTALDALDTEVRRTVRERRRTTPVRPPAASSREELA